MYDNFKNGRLYETNAAYVIKVSIIEDNAYMREGWETFIDFEKDMCIVGSFESCEDAFKSESIKKTDVILMDINLPGISGIDGVKEIRQKYPDIHVVMATIHDDDEHIFSAIKAGAIGYLMKQITPEGLIEAIRDAHNGGSPITPNIARKVIAAFHEEAKLEQQLSEKELEILTQLAKGLSYAAIGKRIFLSVDGVRHHIRNIYRKLEVGTKPEAVAKAIRNRLIDPT